jgi:apolipoprotein D and lipocalin family protein
MMDFLRFVLVGGLLVIGMACSSGSKGSSLATAGRVDLARYAGKWNEIARLPMAFQKAGDAATATYEARADGKVGVHNVATRPDGTTAEIRGTATVLNPGVNTKLAVRFDTWFGPLIPVSKEGNYWILYVSPKYDQALVGTPDRKFLWILARTATVPTGVEADLVARAKALGFETEKLIRPTR